MRPSAPTQVTVVGEGDHPAVSLSPRAGRGSGRGASPLGAALRRSLRRCHLVRTTLRSPSPRLRGEGRGEGASPLGAELRRSLQCCRLVPYRSELRRGPLTLVASLLDLSPRSGERWQALPRSRDAPSHPRSGHATVRKPFQRFLPSKRREAGAARRTLGIRPRRSRTKACCEVGERHRFFPQRCGMKAAAPSPYGAHRGHAPRV